MGSTTASLSLGTCRGRPFLLMAGVGLDAYLAGRVGSSLKQRFGLLAFWLTGLVHFWRYPLPRFQVRMGGECLVGTQAVVANGSRYGGGLRLTPQGDLSRRGFEVCVFQSQSHLRYLVYLLRGFSGSHLSLPDVVYRQACSVHIEGDAAVPVQLDGEPSGGLPVSIQVLEKRLEVFVRSTGLGVRTQEGRLSAGFRLQNTDS